MRHDPVIVAGTTPDYAARIDRKYPGVCLFLLDASFQGNPFLDAIDRASLLFAPLENFEAISQAADRYLSAGRLSPRGIACFDCESMPAASRLALHLRLPYPGPDAVARTRNKFEARRIWKKDGLPSPRAALVSGLQETLRFFQHIKKDIVLKPVSGSGSELLFHCRSEEDVKKSVRIIEEELPRRRSNPLFRPISVVPGDNPVDPCSSWIAEEFVSGPEYSCDFILRDGQIIIMRETGKIKAPDQPFGSILAYTLPPLYPEGFSLESLSHVLKNAAGSLGFARGYFMADYVVTNGHPVIIEMTPRPGGDSIPDLLEIATGRDPIEMYLNFVSGRFSRPERFPVLPESFASINLYARKRGLITRLDTSRLSSLPWVKTAFLKKGVGDRITLPPDDYDNRLLGYYVISVEQGRNIISLCRQFENLLDVSIEENGL
jgi:biotin carboxylase